MNHDKQFYFNERIIAPRLAHGPLDYWERLYREFLRCEYWELLELDPWLQVAAPSPRGRRVLVPLVRRVLGHQGQLPAGMLEWVGLYQQLADSVLEYFDSWSEHGRFEDAFRHGQAQRLKVVGS